MRLQNMEKLHHFTIYFVVFAIIGTIAYPEKGEHEVTSAATPATRRQESLDPAKDECIDSIRKTFGDIVMLHAHHHLNDSREVYLSGLYSLVTDGFNAITDLMEDVRVGKDPINVENNGTYLLPTRKVLCNKDVEQKLGQIITDYFFNGLKKPKSPIVQVPSPSTPQVHRI